MIDMGSPLQAEVAAFAAAYTNVILIPGPSFAVVCEAGLSATRREASLVAVGVACGAGVLATVILQAAPLLRASPGLVVAGRVGCALILLAMGLRMLRRSLRGIRRAERPLSATVARTRFVTGFMAAATNPVSFASFTAAALAVGDAGHRAGCAVVALTVFLMAISWFNTLAVVSSRPFLTTHYGRVATALGLVMGSVLVAKALTSLLSTL